MSKAGTRLIEAANEALAIAKGEADLASYRLHLPADVDVKAIRKGLKLTQSEFAQRFGFTVSQVRDWEQNRFRPTGAARAYLLVIDREPDAVERALRAA